MKISNVEKFMKEVKEFIISFVDYETEVMTFSRIETSFHSDYEGLYSLYTGSYFRTRLENVIVIESISDDVESIIISFDNVGINFYTFIEYDDISYYRLNEYLDFNDYNRNEFFGSLARYISKYC